MAATKRPSSANWNFRDEITFMEQMLLKGQKVNVPKSLRKEMLAIIHKSYLGINKCKSRARDSLFRRSMASKVEQTLCAKNQKANDKEPLMTGIISDKPWSHVSADIMEPNKRHYLFIDRYSKWVELNLLEIMTSKNVLTFLRSQVLTIWNSMSLLFRQQEHVSKLRTPQLHERIWI